MGHCKMPELLQCQRTSVLLLQGMPMPMLLLLILSTYIPTVFCSSAIGANSSMALLHFAGGKSGLYSRGNGKGNNLPMPMSSDKRNLAIKAQMPSSDFEPIAKKENLNIGNEVAKNLHQVKERLEGRISSFVASMQGKDKIPLEVLMRIALGKVGNKFDIENIEKILGDLLEDMADVRCGKKSINEEGELVEKVLEYSQHEPCFKILPEDIQKLGIVLHCLLFDIEPAEPKELTDGEGHLKVEVPWKRAKGRMDKQQKAIVGRADEEHIRREALRLASDLDWDVKLAPSNAPRNFAYANQVLRKNSVERALLALGTLEHPREHAKDLIRMVNLTRALLNKDLDGLGAKAYLAYRCQLVFYDQNLLLAYYIPNMEHLVDKYWPSEASFYYIEELGMEAADPLIVNGAFRICSSFLGRKKTI